ncbi:hypothetical protein, partial [Pseudomonas sp. NPDC089569]|uniref:hypothetical protein n=1 Tax=Pseudomonas sp. NPDC089569 TaxID=3390722 RepID=UPI003CFCF965
MLAKNHWTPRGVSMPASSLAFIASLLAPTGKKAKNPIGWLASNCRSEHAREKTLGTAGCQAASVIVGVHRELARSYRKKSKKSGR